jgi:hypothetical protein
LRIDHEDHTKRVDRSVVTIDCLQGVLRVLLAIAVTILVMGAFASEQAEQQEERKENECDAQVHRTGVLINERSLQSVRERSRGQEGHRGC